MFARVPSGKRARKVIAKGARELQAAVTSGEVSVSAAADVLDLPHEEQLEAVMAKKKRKERKPKLGKKKEEATPANPDTAGIVIGGKSFSAAEYCGLMTIRLTDPGERCFTDRLTNEAIEIVKHKPLSHLCKILVAIDRRMGELLAEELSDKYGAVKNNIAKAVAAIPRHHLSPDSTLTGKGGFIHSQPVAKEGGREVAEDPQG